MSQRGSARTLGNLKWRDLVGDINHPRTGSNGVDDGFAEPDGIVLGVKVGHEADLPGLGEGERGQ